ncbi:MAG: hypothetical protein ACK553_15800 [Planctomycetota bacterium]|jgi:beta-ribofuranosylaminobenzene 5'-phosphate synthase
MIVGVRAFSRLHFGLMEISPGQPHCYGGVGVMIDSPSMTVEARVGSVAHRDDMVVDGDPYWADRTRRALEAWQQQNVDEPIPIRSFRVVSAPPAHVGLGSGTQWACSIAALLELASHGNRDGDRSGSRDRESPDRCLWPELFSSARSLALCAGRGLRSHVGTEGFRSGGVIVDWGQDPREAVGHGASRTEAFSFPKGWRMVTLCDSSYEGDSGSSEAKMFERCSMTPNPYRHEMIRLIGDEMIPAMRASDWRAASLAIGRYGQCAGKIFEPLQGGVYRSPRIADCIDHLRQKGIEGAGQSSWGPTVFALAQDEEQATWVAEVMRCRAAGDALVRIAHAAPPALYSRDSSS